jgi:alcohol dehydrogenase
MSDQVLLFGAGSAGESLRAELVERGIKRVLLLVTPSLFGSPAHQRLLGVALANVDVHEDDGRVRSHAPMADTERIADRARGLPLDAVVALGGGSVSDTAKGVSILLAEGGLLADHCSVFTPPDHFEPRILTKPKLPVVVVPTTLGGAEMTPGGGATDANGTKRTFWDPRVASRVVAYDPEVLRSAPVSVLLATGMNGLAHCAEGLYSRTANPVSTAFARQGSEHLAMALRSIAAGDLGDEALDRAGAGAALGGLVIANARVGLHHAICHVLGAKLGVPHGVANAVMLPHVLRFNLIETVEAQRVFAHAISSETPSGDAADEVDALANEIGIPRRLRDVGVQEADLPMIAEGAMQDRGLLFNPRRVSSSKEVLEILREAW